MDVGELLNYQVLTRLMSHRDLYSDEFDTV